MNRSLFSRTVLFACVAGAVLAGCARFPQIDQRTTRAAADAPYPVLVPLDALLATAAQPGQAEAAAASLEARAAALRARAAALSGGSVIDDATRARLSAAQTPAPG